MLFLQTFRMGGSIAPYRPSIFLYYGSRKAQRKSPEDVALLQRQVKVETLLKQTIKTVLALQCGSLLVLNELDGQPSGYADENEADWPFDIFRPTLFRKVTPSIRQNALVD